MFHGGHISIIRIDPSRRFSKTKQDQQTNKETAHSASKGYIYLTHPLVASKPSLRRGLVQTKPRDSGWIILSLVITWCGTSAFRRVRHPPTFLVDGSRVGGQNEEITGRERHARCLSVSPSRRGVQGNSNATRFVWSAVCLYFQGEGDRAITAPPRLFVKSMSRLSLPLQHEVSSGLAENGALS